MLAKTSIEVVLEILFLFFRNANVKFNTKNLTWRKYIIVEVIPIVNKYKFMEISLNRALETFLIHVVSLVAHVLIMTMQPTTKPLLATLDQNKVLIEVLIEYSNFIDAFSLNQAMKLLGCTKINENSIDFIKDKPSHYYPIYNTSPVELKILKRYRKIRSKTGFIYSLKTSTETLIVFDKKSDRSLYLYINY